MGHTYSLFIIYMKLKFNWCPVFLFAESGNHKRKTKFILEKVYRTSISTTTPYILIEESMDLQSPKNAKPTHKEFYVYGEKKRTSSSSKSR